LLNKRWGKKVTDGKGRIGWGKGKEEKRGKGKEESSIE
jgi:hypothetical protein